MHIIVFVDFPKGSTMQILYWSLKNYWQFKQIRNVNKNMNLSDFLLLGKHKKSSSSSVDVPNGSMTQI